ncbi:MAG: phasin family protein [Pseudomonadota bacterium]
MYNNFEVFQQFGKERFEAASTFAASLAKGFQTIAAEVADYSKNSLETGSAHAEKVLGAKSLDTAVQIQSDYAKSTYEDFLAHTKKVGELYTQLLKEAFTPRDVGLVKVPAGTAVK